MNRLKELRENKGLSLEDLSKEINIPKTSLSNYERYKREPKIEVWNKLAKYFDVSTAYLMGLDFSKDYRKMDDVLTYHIGNTFFKKSLDSLNTFYENTTPLDQGLHLQHYFSNILEEVARINFSNSEDCYKYEDEIKLAVFRGIERRV